ncbi:MAG: HD domain-containing protein [Phenylobacterium sp.]|uniref:HD domain-containing protein n=1 Tax=Phenylobacterium sp. TaxID=1871053 RepID=UPI001227C015|nr:HD domain-containing protein [Phenylobacterium sp.]TAJ72674.1 MAG: HD domain-containing protein [Phenylobacterium sp.]
MADGDPPDAKTGFHAMTEATPEQWAEIVRHAAAFRAELPDRLLGQLRMLEGGLDGYSVSRLEHSLQTATRAHRDGRDEEYVVCALLHDIGDLMGPANHAEIGAVILKPFVSDANHWMLDKHGVFQGYYFFQHLGLDRDLREQHRGHPHFEYCAEFCHRYDQNSFDPGYESMPLEAFEPMLRRVLARPRQSIYLRPGKTA